MSFYLYKGNKDENGPVNSWVQSNHEVENGQENGRFNDEQGHINQLNIKILKMSLVFSRLILLYFLFCTIQISLYDPYMILSNDLYTMNCKVKEAI